MAFHENAIFPEDHNYQTSGGPTHNTIVIALDGGAEQRLAKWNGARRVYEINYEVREHSKLSVLQEFINLRRGAVYGFRLYDWYDCTSQSPGLAPELGGDEPTHSDVLIGEGDGITTQFQLLKHYADDDAIRTRTIRKPIEGTVVIGVFGIAFNSGFSVDYTTGVVTFDFPPDVGAPISAGFKFHVPVRFTEDAERQIRMAVSNYGSGDADAIEMIEDLDPSVMSDERNMGGSKTIVVTANITLSTLNGLVQLLDVQSDGKNGFLPDPTALNLPGGYPYFVLKNTGSFDFDLYHHDLTTGLATLAPDETVEIALEKSTNTWVIW